MTVHEEEDNVLLENEHSVRFHRPSTYSGSACSRIKAIFLGLKSLYLLINTSLIGSILILKLVAGLNAGLIATVFLKYPVNIDFSLRAFEVPNHLASERQDSLSAAVNDWNLARSRHSSPVRSGRSLRQERDTVVAQQNHRKWKLDLIYIAKDGNIFTKDKLEYIHKIENKLMSHPDYQNFCWKSALAQDDHILSSKFGGCMPPNSLLDYFYRTKYYDGQGKVLADISSTLDFLLSRPQTYWYVDEKFSVLNKKSALLRSQINFGVPLKGYRGTSRISIKSQHEVFKNFLIKYVDQLKSASSK